MGMAGVPLTELVDILGPVFGIVALGYAATFTRVFDEAAARGLSSFVFNFALPVALFRTTIGTALPEAPPLGFLAAYYGGTALMFAPALALLPGGIDRRAILGFGSAYSNTVLLGIPLVVAALGPAASVPLFLLIAFHSSIFFTLVTALIELGRGAGESLALLPLRLAKALATNIILLSVLGGIACNIAGLRLPGTLDYLAEYLGRAAFPAALFSMGAALRRYRLGGAIGPAAFMVAAKLVLHPLIVAFLVLVAIDVPILHAQVAILCAALPVGINVYLFAVRYQVAEAESATAILLSNILSIVTVGLTLVLLAPNGPEPGPVEQSKSWNVNQSLVRF